MRVAFACFLVGCSIGCSDGDTSSSNADATPDVSFDFGVGDTHADVASDTAMGGCERFEYVVSGTSCPETGSCPALKCDCAGGFPRTITACTADGCVLFGNCDAICAASSLGDALSCTKTHTGGKDAGPFDGGCIAKTCAGASKNCGSYDDGCGGTLDCGTCSPPLTCGGAGVDNVCGCAKKTCVGESKNCGSIADGCGGTVACGSCGGTSWCGGGGTANVCGCMPSGTETHAPTASADVPRTGGTKTWTTPENIYASDDKSASVQLVNNEQTTYLVSKGYGFGIPSAATIKGIEVTVERKQNIIDTPISDASAMIVRAGSIVGTEHAKTGNWPLTDTVVTYGGPTDLWGTTWTVAQINDPAFGFALATRYDSFAGNGWSFVDQVKIKVYFAVACP